MSEKTFELFYLGQKNSEGEVDKLTDGPFVSIEEAVKFNRKQHGWAQGDYGIVKTKQVFEQVTYNEEEY